MLIGMLGNTYPCVADPEMEPVGPGHPLSHYRQGDDTATRKLAGVAEQVEKGLAHLREIGLQCPETLGTTNLEPVAVLRNQRRDRRYHLLEHGRDLEGLEMHHRQRIHFRLTTVGPF